MRRGVVEVSRDPDLLLTAALRYSLLKVFRAHYSNQSEISSFGALLFVIMLSLMVVLAQVSHCSL